MIEKVSEMLAFRLKSINPEETASVEVMKFSLSVLINFAAIVFLSLFISAFLGTFTSTLTALVALATLRAVSGGFHLPVSEYCVAASTALFLLIPYIPVNSKRSEEHTSELQSRGQLVCRLLLEKKKYKSRLL